MSEPAKLMEVGEILCEVREPREVIRGEVEAALAGRIMERVERWRSLSRYYADEGEQELSCEYEIKARTGEDLRLQIGQTY